MIPFFLQKLNVLFQYLLAFIVFGEKSAINLLLFFTHKMAFFSECFQVFLFSFFCSLTVILLGVIFFSFTLFCKGFCGHFSIGLCIFFLLIYRSLLYLQDIDLLLGICYKYLSYSVAYVFILLCRERKQL